MAYDREADTPAQTLERLKALVVEQLKPDSGISAVDGYYGVVDLLVTWEVADADGLPMARSEGPAEPGAGANCAHRSSG